MKLDPEKFIECYVDSYFAGGCNQEEGKDLVLVLYRTGYVITYATCPIIWASRIQIKIALGTMETEYIALSQVIRYFLPFVGIMKETELVLKLQEDTLTVLRSIFEKPVTVYQYDQVAIALTVDLQMQPCMNHITSKYPHFRIFFMKW